jgi:hypothetical protein
MGDAMIGERIGGEAVIAERQEGGIGVPPDWLPESSSTSWTDALATTWPLNTAPGSTTNVLATVPNCTAIARSAGRGSRAARTTRDRAGSDQLATACSGCSVMFLNPDHGVSWGTLLRTSKCKEWFRCVAEGSSHPCFPGRSKGM